MRRFNFEEFVEEQKKARNGADTESEKDYEDYEPHPNDQVLFPIRLL